MTCFDQKDSMEMNLCKLPPFLLLGTLQLPTCELILLGLLFDERHMAQLPLRSDQEFAKFQTD